MYILYKNPIQLDTLYIVQYLFYLDIILIPHRCIERNHPSEVTRLPSIYSYEDNQWYIGLDECLKFYEMKSKINNILWEANNFKEENPEYRITGRIGRYSP